MTDREWDWMTRKSQRENPEMWALEPGDFVTAKIATDQDWLGVVSDYPGLTRGYSDGVHIVCVAVRFWMFGDNRFSRNCLWVKKAHKISTDALPENVLLAALEKGGVL